MLIFFDALSLWWGSVVVLVSGVVFGGSTAVVGLGAWVSGVVMGFTVVVLVGLGVVCWVGGVVWVVFAGFLGGVGVDLVWGWGACKVIR
ncbi:hypothetical protein AB4Y81_14270, partial [Paenarthrobacter sp. TAF1]|uniref:hypothetical protein n=1 Tax=Paenarthrobacter sp. TAF1 TaxID=3233067 RepID=UPI003F969466